MKKQDENRKAADKKIQKALSAFSGLGLSMVFCLLISFLLGQYIDKVFGTSPTFLILFIILGIAAAFMQIYKLVKKG